MRFDFDPTYFAGSSSSASAHAIKRIVMEQGASLAARARASAAAGNDWRRGLPSASELGLGTPSLAAQREVLKLVFIFRNPAHQACRKLVGKKRRPEPPADEQGGRGSDGGDGAGLAAAEEVVEVSPEQTCWEGVGAARPGPFRAGGEDGEGGALEEGGGGGGGAVELAGFAHPTDFLEYVGAPPHDHHHRHCQRPPTPANARQRPPTPANTRQHPPTP